MRLSIPLILMFAATQALAASWPGAEWPRAQAESVGLDAAPLKRLDQDFASGKFALTDSFLVIRCGKLVFEREYAHDYAKIYGKEAHERGPLNPHLTGPYNYFDPQYHPYYQGTREHTLQSISKSVTATTIGIAIQRGDFKSGLDTPVLHWFDPGKVRNVDERKRRMTLKHVLTMTTGLDWNEDLPYNDPRNSTAPMEASDDWVAFVINLPMAHEPGGTFAYSSGATELLAYIFQRETGQDIEKYARAHLFAPLHIEHYDWKRTPLGLVDTEGGLFLTAPDLARIGYLYLNGGKWQDTQLIDPSFLRQTLTPQVDAGGGWKYGFQWWLRPVDDGKRLVWAARGFGGQRLLVFPEARMIAVTTAWDIIKEGEAFPTVLQDLRAAVRTQACTE